MVEATKKAGEKSHRIKKEKENEEVRKKCKRRTRLETRQ